MNAITLDPGNTDVNGSQQEAKNIIDLLVCDRSHPWNASVRGEELHAPRRCGGLRVMRFFVPLTLWLPVAVFVAGILAGIIASKPADSSQMVHFGDVCSCKQNG